MPRHGSICDLAAGWLEVVQSLPTSSMAARRLVSIYARNERSKQEALLAIHHFKTDDVGVEAVRCMVVAHAACRVSLSWVEE